jgi:hypothetical protein
VTVTPADEAVRDTATDSVTYAFGDASAQLYGLARLGLSTAPGGGRQGSALTVLFAGSEAVAVLAEGGQAIGAGASWDALALAGLRATTEEPLARWSLDLRGADGQGFSLGFSAIGDAVALSTDTPAGQLGGMAGYEQPCRVRGTVRAGGRERAIDALGQRGHTWGDPDWDRIELTRTVTAWTEGGCASLTAVRPAGAPHHSDEVTWAAMWEGDGASGPAERRLPLEIETSRLSTTYDPDGHTRRAGLELWPAGQPGDDWVRRAAGEVLCGSTLDLGSLQLDCSFFSWHLEGEAGVGRYDILRRTTAAAGR